MFLSGMYFLIGETGRIKNTDEVTSRCSMNPEVTFSLWAILRAVLSSSPDCVLFQMISTI